MSDEFGWLGGRDGRGELRFILPYTIVRQHGVRMVRFRVETILTQPGAAEDCEEQAFLTACLGWFKSRGADVVIPASTNTLFRTYPEGARAVPYGSYVLGLTQPLEQLWSGVHSKHRNVIRSAERKACAWFPAWSTPQLLMNSSRIPFAARPCPSWTRRPSIA
ncbi:MAG: hypothetical protein M5U12_08885 [Verrucomicrobia bacterium]|nr:hypothetical protein [Verrucomicrobiota bacterium]